jgi:hypothetical protein
LDLESVPGWFSALDQRIFETFLSELRANSTNEGSCDFLELGAYFGKSSIFIGKFLPPGAKMHVFDLFEEIQTLENAGDASITGYIERGLTKSAFLENWHRFHDWLPNLHQVDSALAPRLLKPKSVGFAHIDALHTFEGTISDIRNTRDLMAKDGVVVIDDYRTQKHPSVAAAVWEAILREDLYPICCSEQKMYCSWDDPSEWREFMQERLSATGHIETRAQSVKARQFISVTWKRPAQPDHDAC